MISLRAWTYTAMRVVLGFIYWAHGVRWLFGAFGGRPATPLTLFWTAGVIETVCGTLIALGLLTPWAAFLASGEMAAAYFRAHAPRGSWPIQNGGELSVVLCFAFLFIAVYGTGPYGLDRFIRRRPPDGRPSGRRR